MCHFSQGQCQPATCSGRSLGVIPDPSLRSAPHTAHAVGSNFVIVQGPDTSHPLQAQPTAISRQGYWSRLQTSSLLPHNSSRVFQKLNCASGHMTSPLETPLPPPHTPSSHRVNACSLTVHPSTASGPVCLRAFAPADLARNHSPQHGCSLTNPRPLSSVTTGRVTKLQQSLAPIPALCFLLVFGPFWLPSSFIFSSLP